MLRPVPPVETKLPPVRQNMSLPEPDDLAAIAMHFNPCGYAAPRRNFERFREHFRGCPLYTAEVSFDGVFHLGCDWQIRAGEEHLLWQKEAIINWMVAKLPSQFTKVAWVDADLIFMNDRWAVQTSEMLNEYHTLQLYSHIHYLSDRGEVERTYASSIFANCERPKMPSTAGGAWAARRSLIAAHGMYPYSIVGGGDSCWLDAIRGERNGKVMQRPTPRLNAHFLKWQEKLYQSVRGRVHYVRGDVLHLYHGTLVDRRYSDRYKMLVDADYDPEADVKIAENGLLEWTSEKPLLHQRMKEYFFSRREDEPVKQKSTAHRSGRRVTHELTHKIIGCYFVTRPDSQRGIHQPADDPSLVETWATTLQEVGCDGVLLVDHEAPRLKKQFLDLQVIRVDDVPAWTHPNAWRWKQLADYLRRNSTTSVFMTDVFDVRFARNPFQLLPQRGCELWIGIEDSKIGGEDRAACWLKERLRKTIGEFPIALIGRQMLNAGIVGGKADAVGKLADQMWQLLSEKGARGDCASDMAALNSIVHSHWPAAAIWCHGAPLHSHFRKFETTRKDVCIIHK